MERRFRDSDIAVKSTVIAFFILLIHPILSNDFWWNLATGRHIVLNRAIPMTDIFSFTAYGADWINHQWLGHVIFYLSYHLGGIGGAVLFKALVMVGILIILYRRMSPFNSDFSILLYFVVLSCLVVSFPLERPRTFTLFFLALFTYIFERHERDGTRYIWVLPPLFILWANLHGGFVFGFVVISFFILDASLSREFSKAKTYASVLILCFFAAFITPYGYKTLLYPLRYAEPSVYVEFGIREWQPTHVEAFPLFASMAAAGIAVLLMNRYRVKTSDILLLLFFSVYAMRLIRLIPAFGIVSGPIIFKYLEWSLLDLINKRRGTRFRRLGWELLDTIDFNKARTKKLCYSLFYLILLFQLSMFFTHSHGLEPAHINERFFPDDATDVILESQIGGNLFNYYDWGGFCIWKLYPQYMVFIDGRDLYVDLYDEYHLILNGKPGWDERLDSRNVTVVLIPKPTALANKIARSEGWRLLYHDDWNVVFAREQPP